MDLWSDSVLTSFLNKTIFPFRRCRRPEGTLNLAFNLNFGLQSRRFLTSILLPRLCSRNPSPVCRYAPSPPVRQTDGQTGPGLQGSNTNKEWSCKENMMGLNVKQMFPLKLEARPEKNVLISSSVTEGEVVEQGSRDRYWSVGKKQPSPPFNRAQLWARTCRQREAREAWDYLASTWMHIRINE